MSSLPEFAWGGAISDTSAHSMQRKTKAQKKVSKVMREYAAGTLNSGSKKGPRVKSREQAIAIALSEAGVRRRRRAR